MKKKKTYELSARGRRAVKSARNIPDAEIDFSDAPELTDDQLKTVKRVGRPTQGDEPKQLIAIRLDPQLLKRIKAQAKKSKVPYQSLIQKVLAANL